MVGKIFVNSLKYPLKEGVYVCRQRPESPWLIPLFFVNEPFVPTLMPLFQNLLDIPVGLHISESLTCITILDIENSGTLVQYVQRCSHMFVHHWMSIHCTSLNVYIVHRCWILDILIALYYECLPCTSILDIGHSHRICTVNVYLAHQWVQSFSFPGWTPECGGFLTRR